MGDAVDSGYSVPTLEVAPASRRRSALGIARGLSCALLASLLSALIGLADRMLDTWSNGSLLLALLVLWAVLFTGLALFGRATGLFAWGVVAGFHAWSERVAREDAREHAMGLPRSGERVMADVNAALMRDEQDGVATRLVAPVFYRPW